MSRKIVDFDKSSVFAPCWSLWSCELSQHLLSWSYVCVVFVARNIIYNPTDMHPPFFNLAEWHVSVPSASPLVYLAIPRAAKSTLKRTRWRGDAHKNMTFQTQHIFYMLIIATLYEDVRDRMDEPQRFTSSQRKKIVCSTEVNSYLTKHSNPPYPKPQNVSGLYSKFGHKVAHSTQYELLMATCGAVWISSVPSENDRTTDTDTLFTSVFCSWRSIHKRLPTSRNTSVPPTHCRSSLWQLWEHLSVARSLEGAFRTLWHCTFTQLCVLIKGARPYVDNVLEGEASVVRFLNKPVYDRCFHLWLLCQRF